MRIRSEQERGDSDPDGSRIPDNASRYASVLCERVIRIAVQPPLAWFGRCDDGMFGGTHMSGGVAVGRRIATERHATRLTRAQMHPARVDLDALLAFPAFRLLHGVDAFNVG